MKWVAYTGQPDTLPPEGVTFLVHRRNGSYNLTHWTKEDHTGVAPGDSWLLIPTQQQCEAREKAKDALEFYADYTTYKYPEIGDLPILQDDGDKARKALAALEAAEKENGNGDATLLRRVAVEVMGRHPDSCSADVMGDFTWDYVGWVVERMRELGYNVSIRWERALKIWNVSFHDARGGVEASADTMPRAVMLAALKAKKVKP